MRPTLADALDARPAYSDEAHPPEPQTPPPAPPPSHRIEIARPK
jgi:hypothetical protein